MNQKVKVNLPVDLPCNTHLSSQALVSVWKNEIAVAESSFLSRVAGLGQYSLSVLKWKAKRLLRCSILTAMCEEPQREGERVNSWDGPRYSCSSFLLLQKSSQEGSRLNPGSFALLSYQREDFTLELIDSLHLIQIHKVALNNMELLIPVLSHIN